MSFGGKIVMQKYATEMYDEKNEVSESDVNDEHLVKKEECAITVECCYLYSFNG